MRLENLIPNLSERFQHFLKEDRPYVTSFCSQTGCELINISWDEEHFPPQGLMYFFDDNLGGYNITGIKGSLEDVE